MPLKPYESGKHRGLRFSQSTNIYVINRMPLAKNLHADVHPDDNLNS